MSGNKESVAEESFRSVACSSEMYCHPEMYCSSPMPYKRHSCILYCTKFLNLQILWIFNRSQKCITKIFLRATKSFHAVTEKDPVVSIALLTIAKSSEQLYSSACLINLACMPHPTVPAHGIQMQRLFQRNVQKLNCWNFCTVHYVLCSYDGIGI